MGIGAIGPAVFLDRDGVINHASVRDGVSYPPQSAAEFRLMPGVEEACRRLRQAGYPLVVVTNQPDMARGSQTRERVEEINDLVRRCVPVLDILTCYHDNADGCGCRKPKPGLLLLAAERWGIDLRTSFMVGDRWSDIQAGQAAGCASILIERGDCGRERCQPDWIASDLPEAADIILRGNGLS